MRESMGGYAICSTKKGEVTLPAGEKPPNWLRERSYCCCNFLKKLFTWFPCVSVFEGGRKVVGGDKSCVCACECKVTECEVVER